MILADTSCCIQSASPAGQLAGTLAIYIQTLSAVGVTPNGLGVSVDSPVTFLSLCYSA